MSVTSGFFNSVNHDRRYNAAQMSAIFDGIINDGVFANIGVAFAVSAHTGVTISIGKGRAWFNSAWVYNDGPLLKTLEGSEVVLDRIDAVVIEVDHNENVRLGDIKIVKGTPASTPQRPKMAADTYKHQYPLAYIYRKAGSTAITQADITSMIGTSSCPYITGILQVQNIDNIVAQWGAQWNQWYSEMVAETNADASALLAEMRSEFEIWFRDMANILEGDVGATLAAQVAELMGKFDDLARDACVYDTIEDSDLDVILGSDGTPIQGKTVFSGSGGGSVEGVTAKDIGAVAIDGSTPMTGNLNVNQNRIMNVAEPEEDSDAASAGYVKSVVKNSKTPSTIRNLLDNSDFTNPVNQNGATDYTSGYGLDRWVATGKNSRWSIVNGGLEVCTADAASQPYIDQRIPEKTVSYTADAGKKYTVAAKIDGSIYVAIETVGGVSGGVNTPFGTMVFLYSPSAACMAVRFNLLKTETHVIEWAALYEGEYTLETLPEYHSIGYENELLVCRQYDPVTGKYIGLRKFGTAHNLLDNSDFTNPVNRKGSQTYESSAALLYSIDRWCGTYSTVTVHDGFVKFKAEKIAQYKRIGQYVSTPVKAGKTYTMAMCAKINDIGGYFTLRPMDNLAGVSGCAGVNIPVKPDDYEVFTYSFTLATQPTKLGIEILMAKNAETYADIDIKWFALYEGEYTIDTLPEYQPKGYEQELLICNQYDPVTGEYIGLRKFGQPYNLLDNSDFTNPVNQSGKTSYTGNNFTIDKWRTTNGATTHELTPKGLKVSGTTSAIHSIQTTLENPAQYVGKTMTLCAFIEENNASVPPQLAIHYGNGSNNQTVNSGISCTIPLGATGLVIATGVMADMGSYAYANPNIRIGSGTGSLVVKWMALYEGVYSIDTLPDYVPKERVVEERNCGIVPFAPDLLWQNASVESQFDPQTIVLDLSKYAWLILEWSFSTENDNRYTMLIPTRDTSKHEMHINATSQNRDGGRLVSVDGNNVVFEAGKYNTSTNNKNAIPTRIWGLKEAMV